MNHLNRITSINGGGTVKLKDRFTSYLNEVWTEKFLHFTICSLINNVPIVNTYTASILFVERPIQ